MVVVVDKVVSGSCFSSSSLLLPLVNKSANFYNNNKSVVAISSGRRRRKSGSLRCSSSHSQNINSNRNTSNYVVSFDSSSCITRPLAEILRDLNKRIPDNIITTTINNKKPSSSSSNTNTNTNTNNNTLKDDQDQVDDADIPSKTTYSIPWYHANRMLSFYAPGWCGEIRDVIFSDDASVTVVYRVTIRGSDGEAHRESTGTVSPQMNNNNNDDVDAVAAAEEIAFCRACARFGLGLYLYHDE